VGRGSSRNQPCWCGSGKKYKYCHFGREHDPRVSIWDARRSEQKILSSKTCLHPQASESSCFGPIVRAHTVRRSADLQAIARDGHVYHPDGDIAALNRTRGRIPAKLIGIKDASTFWGFCQRHDTGTFSALENEPFLPTDEQAFLLAYRPLVKELYLKERLIESFEIMRSSDKGKPLPYQKATQEYARISTLAAASSLRDLRAEKEIYDADLLASEFGAIRFVSIELEGQPDMVCSGVVQPTVSFDGQRIQDLVDLGKRLKDIAFSILATPMGGRAVFSWRSNADAACSPLVDSLLSMPWSLIPHALVRFALSEFENVFFRPSWWESLPSQVATALEARFMHGVDPRYGTGVGYTHDDGVRAVDWEIRDVKEKRG
jgi:hypothetical protein